MVPYADAIEGVLDSWDAAKYMEIGEMSLHAGTVKDILNSWDITKYMEIGGIALNAGAIKTLVSNWGATMYDGSRDVRPWLMEIEEKYRIHGIPEIHMTDMAVKFTNGEVNTVLTAMYKARVAEAGAWSWEDFKESVIKIEGKRNRLYQPRPWTPLTNRGRRLQGKYEMSVSNIRRS